MWRLPVPRPGWWRSVPMSSLRLLLEQKLLVAGLFSRVASLQAIYPTCFDSTSATFPGMIDTIRN